AWPDGGRVHQIVSLGGIILWLRCGIGPVPAVLSGADSGGGAGSAALGPAGGAAASPGVAGAWGAADQVGGGACWGRGRDDDAGTAPGAGVPWAGVPAPGAGRCSHQRWSAGTGGRAGATADCSRVASRLRLDNQSG